MNDSQFKEISARLDKIIQLLALNSLHGLEPERQIQVLSSLGFRPSEIASLVQKTPNAVSIVLHRLKKAPRPLN